ncbi:MAG: ANTAR domain-containing protein [Clostridia bacterium]|nr:ANTAR domain-containing protein [Clostridia bacterium]
MPLREHVYSLLLVSAAEKLNASLLPLFPAKDYAPVDVARSIAEAQRRIAECPYDLVIVNTPLPDDFGRKFASELCADGGTAAMLLVKSELYEEIFDKVLDYGVFVLPKPTSAAMVTQSLAYMRATRERMRRLEKKSVSLEDKMAEIRIVNRAKWALIERHGMTEAEAHRFIEKTAMDRSATRREIAEKIVDGNY